MTEDQDVPRSSAHAPGSVGEPKPSSAPKFLIANLELEFGPNHSKQSPLTFSNRKFLTIFHPEIQPAVSIVAHLTHRWPRTSIVRSSRCRSIVRGHSQCKTGQLVPSIPPSAAALPTPTPA